MASKLIRNSLFVLLAAVPAFATDWIAGGVSTAPVGDALDVTVDWGSAEKICGALSNTAATEVDQTVSRPGIGISCLCNAARKLHTCGFRLGKDGSIGSREVRGGLVMDDLGSSAAADYPEKGIVTLSISRAAALPFVEFLNGGQRPEKKTGAEILGKHMTCYAVRITAGRGIFRPLVWRCRASFAADGKPLGYVREKP